MPMRRGFLRHMHPPNIPRKRASFSYTLCMGGTAFLLFMLLCISGMLLMFHYQPDPKQAAASVWDLDQVVPFGRFVRSVHYWCGQAMVLCVLLHMVRVAWTGAYQPPRRWNWLVGLFLLVLTVSLDFSGYVLRWDDQGQRAAVVAFHLMQHVPWMGEGLSEVLLGGEPNGAAGLLRWYVWHCVNLPLALALAAVYHFWRVRRDGQMAPL